MADLLNSSAIMMCPHGGTVSAIATDTRVVAQGNPRLGATDTYIIAGCAFVIGIVPHPCVQVQWVQPDSRSQAGTEFTLSEESVGLCVAADMAVQGTVIITFTQSAVSGT